jgi:hypothetical protein
LNVAAGLNAFSEELSLSVGEVELLAMLRNATAPAA